MIRQLEMCAVSRPPARNERSPPPSRLFRRHHRRQPPPSSLLCLQRRRCFPLLVLKRFSVAPRTTGNWLVGPHTIVMTTRHCPAWRKHRAVLGCDCCCIMHRCKFPFCTLTFIGGRWSFLALTNARNCFATDPTTSSFHHIHTINNINFMSNHSTIIIKINKNRLRTHHS
jgi:hypothetical protein